MCNKIGYESRGEAVTDAKRIAIHNKYRNEKRALKSVKMRPYLCRDCNSWHLTTQKQGRKMKQTRTKAYQRNHDNG